MPQIIEVTIDPAALTAGSNRSPIIAVNNAQFLTLIMQFSAALSAGQWVVRAATSPDNTILGPILATVNFSATDRVVSATVEIAQKYVYVQQVNAPVGGTIQAASILTR
jgi:hypothetical protein